MKQEKVIDVRGRRLGGATPLICSPLVAKTATRLAEESAAVLGKRPDVIEWRVDYFEGVADAAAVLASGRALRAAAGETPIIFTCRAAHEGGQPIALDAEGIAKLYGAVGAAGLFDFLDFELSNPPALVRRVRERSREQGARLILSYHNFGYTPGRDFLVDRFLEADRLGADVAKVAAMPRDRADVLALLEATAVAEAKARIPLISMSMGPLGVATRMVGGVFGSSLSFAIGEGASAPGQMPIADLAAVFAALARAQE
ncbi:MAG: type I 3-dehydroquinate dehydratase [Betaproteobacteria bacterium]|jgi:3-dehydroquinate dehydratase-1|nr:type I 3-dehydroquinate dehydratase [Betaproteobacteria bacterium]